MHFIIYTVQIRKQTQPVYVISQHNLIFMCLKPNLNQFKEKRQLLMHQSNKKKDEDRTGFSDVWIYDPKLFKLFFIILYSLYFLSTHFCMRLERRLFQLILRENENISQQVQIQHLKKINWLSFCHRSISGIITTARNREFHWLILNHVFIPVVWACYLLSEEGMRQGWSVQLTHESNIFKTLSQCCHCQFTWDLSTPVLSFQMHHIIVKTHLL